MDSKALETKTFESTDSASDLKRSEADEKNRDYNNYSLSKHCDCCGKKHNNRRDNFCDSCRNLLGLTIFRIGIKQKGKSFSYIEENDKAYCSWVLRQNNCDCQLLDFQRYLLSKEERNKILYQFNNKNSETPKQLNPTIENQESQPGSILPEKLKSTIDSPHKNPRPKKQNIGNGLRQFVWKLFMGENIAIGKCMCCGQNDISIQNTSAECGHIISRKNGGQSVFQNLRPICSSCNRSMSSTNMDEYMRDCGFDRGNPIGYKSISFQNWDTPDQYKQHMNSR